MPNRGPRPDYLEDVLRLRDQGLFADALAAFDKIKPETAGRLQSQAIRAELLERVGRPKEANAIVRRVLAGMNVSDIDRSLCNFVLARIDIDSGNLQQAIENLNKSITMAKRAGDLERTCAAQLKLVVVLSDGVGTDAIAALLADLRANATRSGNPRILAAVHTYFAQIEALRGSVKSARRHISLANQLLDGTPNLWLESVVENICLALSIMTSEFEAAEVHARKGLELVRRTGGATEYAVNQGNSGFLWHSRGQLDEAVECYERALSLLIPGSEAYNGTLDSLARVRLAQGRLDACSALLLQIKPTGLPKRDRSTYVFRHQLLTRAQLAIKEGETSKASRILEEALRVGEESRDQMLTASALLGKIDVAILNSDTHAVRKFVDRVYPLLRDQSAELYARYERALGEADLSTGNHAASHDHLRRSSRIYEGLHHIQGLLDLHKSPIWLTTTAASSAETSSGVAAALHSFIAILSNAKQLEFVARELVALLGSTHFIAMITAIASSPSSGDEVLAQQVGPGAGEMKLKQRRIRVGESNGKLIEVVVEFLDGVEETALVNAATNLLACAAEICRARDDRGERATIWPVDEVSAYSEGVVLNGQLREVMTYAQRVARTSINVLITGESGTGKEIIARAIHEFSDRAQKPFLPLNCAAVPRDLLESQLFGYRRGAFTGADRDQLGLVRHAAGGTLFLDEVGEMSLELQPKLLRFLESGEIAPLGEPSPLHVNVRVVAATNSNLEDAVRDGRFREDLFYRLNVVPLNIKPLRERRDEIPGMVTQFVAHAAREYKKGYLEVAEETMERLILYRWPGNVRQLQNEIRRMVALAEPDSTLDHDAISPDILAALPQFHHTPVNGREIAVPLRDKLHPTLSRIEYEMIKTALRDNHGRLEPAARSLGISRKGLYLKRQRLGL